MTFHVQITGYEMCLLVLLCGYICCLFVWVVAALESKIMFVDLEKFAFFMEPVFKIEN